MLNFKFVAPHQRVLAVNMCAIIWNAYLRCDHAAEPLRWHGDCAHDRAVTIGAD
jgi:hypothetical protein